MAGGPNLACPPSMPAAERVGSSAQGGGRLSIGESVSALSVVFLWQKLFP